MNEPTVRLVASESGKPLVRVFLSFAQDDAAVARRLWHLLAKATAADATYEFRLWRFDEAILMGEDWDAQIRAALAVSEVGLLAVSNAFLASQYITGVELPALVDVPGKRAIPLAVQQISRHADLHGLAGKQIYGHLRPFGDVRGRAAQVAWVNELVDQIHRVLARYTAGAW
jgi:hypothetical protein